MRYMAFAVALLASCTFAADVDITVQADSPGRAISPYIFGMNHDFAGPKDATIRRFGGNSSETYNWENNFNNSGNDYRHANTDWIARYVPADQKSVPAAALIQFHDESIRRGVPSIITVPLAGYVAADNAGPVAEKEAAPSRRWKKVVAAKKAPFSLTPDTKDDVIYIDELVNYLVKKYGPADSKTGIQFYALGNEPDLWNSTHPRIWPKKPSLRDFTARSIEMASAIKAVDPKAKIIGLNSWHMFGAMTFADAPDWGEIKKSGQYAFALDYYLDEFRKASEADKIRLLDVLSIHTYWSEQALEEGGQRGVIQHVRSLWEEGYHEPSWVGEVVRQGTPYFPKMHASVDRYYPGTLLATTEYDRGLVDQVFGGLALTDTLGAMIAQDLYIATAWPLTGFDGERPAPYAVAARDLFLNSSGKGSRFGDLYLPSTISNQEISSAFASRESRAKQLHLILTNKNFHDGNNFRVKLQGAAAKAAKVYGFDENSAEIYEMEPVRQITDGQFRYSLKRRSAIHMVFLPDALPAGYSVKPPPPKAASPLQRPDLLTSFEDDLHGWQLVTDPEKQAASVMRSEKFATDGKWSLAIEMYGGWHSAIRVDGPDTALFLKEANAIQMDVTYPGIVPPDWFQLVLGGMGEKMNYSQADAQRVQADGKPHTLTFDITKWKIPDDPGWFFLQLITNVPENSSPGTVYIDNIRVVR